MGHFYNVLIILVITLLMAVATSAVAYFVDFVPSVFDSAIPVESNAHIRAPVLD